MTNHEAPPIPITQPLKPGRYYLYGEVHKAIFNDTVVQVVVRDPPHQTPSLPEVVGKLGVPAGDPEHAIWCHVPSELSAQAVRWFATDAAQLFVVDFDGEEFRIASRISRDGE